MTAKYVNLQVNFRMDLLSAEGTGFVTQLSVKIVTIKARKEYTLGKQLETYVLEVKNTIVHSTGRVNTASYGTTFKVNMKESKKMLSLSGK